MVHATGVFAQSALTTQAPNNAAPKASDTSSTGSSSSNSATISANDFLTLLVTEMQNQDPTQATDPNEYINQLVNVNSLEQLISINQNLSTALGVPPSGSSVGSNTPAAQSSSPSTPSVPAAQNTMQLPQGLAHGPSHGLSRFGGNLSAPSASPAAQRVASSLDGRPAA